MRAWVGGLLAATLFLSLRPSVRADEPAASSAISDALCAVLPEVKNPPALDRKAEKLLRSHLDASRAAYEKSDYGLAVSELRAAYDIKPVGEVVYNIAQACREAGKDALSLLLYEQALRIDIDPALKTDCRRHIEELHVKLAQGEDQRARGLVDKKDYDGAIAAWQAAFAHTPDASYLFGQAEAHRQAGRQDQALDAYERYVTTNPNHAKVGDAKREMARIRAEREDHRANQLASGGEYLKAASAWDTAYQQQQQPIFLFRGAESFFRAGQLRDSLASHRRFLGECPPTEWTGERAQSKLRIAELEKRLAPVPVYKKAWFWATIAGSVVLVGTAVGLGVALGRPDPLNGVPDNFRRTID